MSTVGPNCFLAQEYLTAMVIAKVEFRPESILMCTLPADTVPKEAPVEWFFFVFYASYKLKLEIELKVMYHQIFCFHFL